MNIYCSKIPKLFRKTEITLFGISFYTLCQNKIKQETLIHQNCHKEQWKKYWYFGFVLKYLYEFLVRGKNNKLEIQANVKERLSRL